MNKRVLSGIQPTGRLTLGNYLGAMKQWVHYQHDHESFFCIVDLHAVTVPHDPQDLTHHTRLMVASYLATGIDPIQSTIFVQSHNPEHMHLSWLLSCITPMGWLNRMTQFKEKAGKHRETASLGLYAYPVLMAADILVYKATHVPVGDDQKQHLELARDIAQTFNHRFDVDYFPLPEPLIQGPATRIMSLRDGTKKMSKSDESDYSRINLDDTADDIMQKIRKAKTDAEPLPETIDQLNNRPEARNFINIMAAIKNCAPHDILRQYSDKPFSVFKPDLAECVIEELRPMQQKCNFYLQDTAEIDRILKIGAEKARSITTQTIQDVNKFFGFYQFS